MATNANKFSPFLFSSTSTWLAKAVAGGVLIALTFMQVNHTQAQNFLEMPELNDVPELEERSMLLDLDIPPVIARDPDPAAGPRLNVKEFRIQGIFDFPEYGISKEEVIERVEAIRFDLMEEEKLLDSGYTENELAEVSDLMAEIEEETKESHVTPLDVQRLVFLIREQRRSRGITLGMIESVADTITQYYRERGFILAKAYIPKQHVRDGIVNLTLMVGELGEIEVENNKLYRSSAIRRIFSSSIGKPVTYQRVEQDLYLMNDLPGFTGQGFFQPGTQVGDTRITVTASREKRFAAATRLDNHGSNKTGEYRAFIDLALNNPLGLGDSLGVSFLKTISPSNSDYYSLRYSTMLLNPRYRANIGYSLNDFVTGSGNTTEDAGGFDIFGESKVLDAGFSYIWKRSRKFNASFNLSYGDIETELAIPLSENNPFLVNTLVDYYAFGFSMDRLREKTRSLHIINAQFKKDNVEDTLNFTEFDKEPIIFTGDYTRFAFIKHPLSNTPARLITKFGFHYAGEPSTTVSQFALSGPKRTRGFNLNRYFADDGAYTNVDVVFDSKLLNGARFLGERIKGAFQPYIFFDAAWGVEREVSVGAGEFADLEATLANVGLGVKFSHRALKANLSLAAPIVENFETEVEDADSVNLFFDLQYSF